MCIEKDCKQPAQYNYKGQKAKYCGKHCPEPDKMINVCCGNYCIVGDCIEKAIYNFKDKTKAISTKHLACLLMLLFSSISWGQTYLALEPFLKSRAVMGVFLGDELAWSCIPFSNISAAAGLCVVNAEAGKGVHLSSSSSQGVGSEGPGWQMRDGFTGAVTLHRQGASLSDGTGEASISGAPGGALFNIPTGRVASSASVCPPGGNVRMASNLFPALHLRVSGQRL
jgi:hypothetical protein